MHTGSASVNGTLTSLDEARIPLADRGFLFGHAVFETLLVLDAGVVFWKEHMERLKHGCQRARIPLPPEEEIWAATCAVVEHNLSHSDHTPRKMQLRLMISGGTEASFWTPATPALNPTLALFCRNIPGPSPHMVQKGLRLEIVNDSRSAAFLDVKSNGYLPALVAFAEAADGGFDDALYRNPLGELTEATTANILWFTPDGGIHTTVPSGRCLPGTTIVGLERALARSERGALQKGILCESMLGSMLGMAIISATRGAVPVSAVGAHAFDVGSVAPLIARISELLIGEQRASARPLA